MNLKQKFAYVAVGCVLTFACYCVITLGTEIFNPQNASAQVHENTPTTGEIMADLLGRRIMTKRTVAWFDIYSMRNFVDFNVDRKIEYGYAVEFIASTRLGNNPVELLIAYRKTDTDWELASVKNLRVRR